MGWISARRMKTGRGIGTGPKGGKHKGPLRKILYRIRLNTEGLFGAEWVMLECGHEGPSLRWRPRPLRDVREEGCPASRGAHEEGRLSREPRHRHHRNPGNRGAPVFL